jgi:cobalt/nickel transport system permease protein
LSAKNNSFIEHSILGALSFLKESVFSDEYANKSGFLQSLNPKIKTITFLIFVISAVLAKNIFVLILLYLLCLFLTYLSKIDAVFFLKRTWIFIPVFSLFIALPALFGIFSPGEALFSFKLFGLKLIITRPGLFGAILFVARVVTSVSLVILLNLTTRHSELLKVLRIFKIPQIFVSTLNMCYRYIFLFAEIIENTYRAIKSRVGSAIHYKRGQRIVTWSIANLWQRSFQLNQEVYNAMLSRGYRGEPQALDEFKVKIKDWVWLLFAVLIFTGTIVYLNYE